MFDLLIAGGWIVDGSGNPWFRADLGIEGDCIRAIWPARQHGGTSSHRRGEQCHNRAKLP